MTALKPYPNYKPSGVEWLGDIPVGWKAEKLKYNTYMKGRIGWQNLRASEFTETGPFLITGMNFKDGKINWDEVYHISEERYNEAPEIKLQLNDVLMTKDGTIGKLLFIDYLPNKTSLNSHLLVLRPLRNKYHPRYLYYQLGGYTFNYFVEIKKTGTTFYGITQEAVSQFPMLLPTSIEQTRIAEFLDVECGKIDALIAKSENMVALLDEKRQAVITHYVTKGTNLNPNLKPSGIDWLGDIPATWEAVKLRFLCKINTGAKDTENYVEDGAYPFFVRSDTVERIDTYSYDGEAVLTAGDGVGVGKVFHYYNGKFDFHQRVYAFTAFRKITGKYFHLTFANFFKYQMYLNSAKSTVDSVRLPFLQNFVFPIPTIPEQVEIIKTIEEKTAKIDALKEKIIKQIELLKERKTSLITAAVTGKIDVRDYKKQQEAA